jgi:hypothetical protein
MRTETKRKEELEAATNAKALLSELTPASALTNRMIFVLRSAANVATTATYLRLGSEQSLNELRLQAAKLLNVVCGLLDRGRLDLNSINGCRAAVQAWLDALSPEDNA